MRHATTRTGRTTALLLMLAATIAAAAPAQALDCAKSPLDHDEKRLLGGSENLCRTYGGKVILVVNTASKCGYTPQYEGLEKLYKTRREQGFVVLGFPSDDFYQEPGSDEKIATFCSANYGVSFPMFGKLAVRGSDADPFYKDLKKATGTQPSWNFNKYLIGRDGKVIAHYPSDVTPDDTKLLEAIDRELAKPAAAVAGTP